MVGIVNYQCKTALIVLAALCGGVAHSQALRDPTQPPPALASATGAAAATAPAEPPLQSILISLHAGGRRVAVIDGEVVREGEKFRDAVLVKIKETEVVLQKGKKPHSLKLGPNPVPTPKQELVH